MNGGLFKGGGFLAKYRDCSERTTLMRGEDVGIIPFMQDYYNGKFAVLFMSLQDI